MGKLYDTDMSDAAWVSMLLVNPPKRLDENPPKRLLLRGGGEFGGACLGRSATAAWHGFRLGHLPCGGFRQQVGMSAEAVAGPLDADDDGVVQKAVQQG